MTYKSTKEYFLAVRQNRAIYGYMNRLGENHEASQEKKKYRKTSLYMEMAKGNR